MSRGHTLPLKCSGEPSSDILVIEACIMWSEIDGLRDCGEVADQITQSELRRDLAITKKIFAKSSLASLVLHMLPPRPGRLDLCPRCPADMAIRFQARGRRGEPKPRRSRHDY